MFYQPNPDCEEDELLNAVGGAIEAFYRNLNGTVDGKVAINQSACLTVFAAISGSLIAMAPSSAKRHVIERYIIECSKHGEFSAKMIALSLDKKLWRSLNG